MKETQPKKSTVWFVHVKFWKMQATLQQLTVQRWGRQEAGSHRGTEASGEINAFISLHLVMVSRGRAHVNARRTVRFEDVRLIARQLRLTKALWEKTNHHTTSQEMAARPPHVGGHGAQHKEDTRVTKTQTRPPSGPSKVDQITFQSSGRQRLNPCPLPVPHCSRGE